MCTHAHTWVDLSTVVCEREPTLAMCQRRVSSTGRQSVTSNTYDFDWVSHVCKLKCQSAYSLHTSGCPRVLSYISIALKGVSQGEWAENPQCSVPCSLTYGDNKCSGDSGTCSACLATNIHSQGQPIRRRLRPRRQSRPANGLYCDGHSRPHSRSIRPQSRHPHRHQMSVNQRSRSSTTNALASM
jgi:prepilin-type processing-associated H-X9-DG protein